jgi:hypothetical protein
MDRMVKSFDSLVKSSPDFGPGWTADRVVQEFAKAVATNAGLFAPSGAEMGNMAPLMLQNLDSVLTSVLFTEEHLQLFGTFPRVPSNNLNYMYDRRLRYGGGRRATGFVEGGAPSGGTSAWERDSATIRFMGVKRGITHQLMQVGTMGGSHIDPVAEENRNGTLELLEEVERQIFFGQEAIKDNAGRTVNYDGVLVQMQNSKFASANVIDKAGKNVDFTDLEDAAQLLMQRYYVTSFKDVKCLAHPGIIADFSKLRLNIDRRLVQQGTVPGQWVGEPFLGYTSNFGNIPIKPHIFFERVKNDAPLAATDGADPGAPASPAQSTPTAGADASGKSTLKAGTYYYSVAAVNDSGESLPTVSAAVTASAGQAITVPVTQVSGATCYRFYRGALSDGSDHQWVADVADAGVGGTSYVDINQKIPGSGTMMLWVNTPDNIVVPQFLPLLRWPIAITTTTIEWFILLYHTLKIKAPERVVIFTNVGRL